MLDSRLIRLIDGEGGRATSRLVREVFLERFKSPSLNALCDSAIRAVRGGELAFTTDGFVVDPLFFTGGNIGKLAICGTVNDLSAMAAKPIMISAAFIIEEGFEIERLERIVEGMAEAAPEAGVEISAGDTKVVPRGKADGIFITTSGIGEVVGFARRPELIRDGDALVISGDIARHAGAVVAVREALRAEPPIESDCAPLWNMVESALEAAPQIHAMRDPTRGGLGGILCELAEQSEKRFVVEESAIPISPQIHNLCELFGYDPLFMACEGRMLFALPAESAPALLEALRSSQYGRMAAIIGRVEAGSGVVMNTRFGGKRLIVEPEGAPLPRIC